METHFLKTHHALTAGALLGGVVLLGGVGRYFDGGRTQTAFKPIEVTEVLEIPAPIAERVVVEGTTGESAREYKNEKYRFLLSYPQQLTVKEYDESGGAVSITFESTVDEKGFQIYVTPYKGNQITEERFRLDAPSGVRKDLVEVVVDGTRGIIFFSEHSLMGETREVWFIKNGYLYEVVTYKDLDIWLAEIMKTWKFL